MGQSCFVSFNFVCASCAYFETISRSSPLREGIKADVGRSGPRLDGSTLGSGFLHHVMGEAQPERTRKWAGAAQAQSREAGPSEEQPAEARPRRPLRHDEGHVAQAGGQGPARQGGDRAEEGRPDREESPGPREAEPASVGGRRSRARRGQLSRTAPSPGAAPQGGAGRRVS